MKQVFGNNPRYVAWLGSVSLLMAALLAMRVQDMGKNPSPSDQRN